MKSRLGALPLEVQILQAEFDGKQISVTEALIDLAFYDFMYRAGK